MPREIFPPAVTSRYAVNSCRNFKRVVSYFWSVKKQKEPKTENTFLSIISFTQVKKKKNKKNFATSRLLNITSKWIQKKYQKKLEHYDKASRSPGYLSKLN